MKLKRLRIENFKRFRAPLDPEPSSTDIPYYQLWKEEWKQLNFDGIKKSWLKE